MNCGLFIDTTAIYFSVGYKYNKRKIHYENYVKYLQNNLKIDGFKYKYAYILQENSDSDPFTMKLRYLGFDTKNIFTRYQNKYSVRVDLIIDTLKLSERLDSVVLCINNPQYIELIDELKSKGIICNISCCNVPMNLKHSCNFIPITEEILIGNTDENGCKS